MTRHRAQLWRERRPDDQTTGAPDKAPLPSQPHGSCGSSLYNQVRPHGALGYQPPAPAAILPLPAPNSL
jgi:transposase InsO family protein